MIITAGEILVEFVSHETGCALSTTTQFSGPYPSGAPAIFADQVANVGGQSAILGSVGNDPFGKLLLNRLQSDGVNTGLIRTSATQTTETAFVSYFEDGSRTFVFHLLNTAAHEFLDIPTLAPGSIFHISGASLGNPKIRETIMAMLEQAKSIGKVSYDPNIRPELLQDNAARASIDEIIQSSDYLLPSLDDLNALFPSETPESFINSMLERGKSAVVVKQGAKGAIGSSGDGIIAVDPIAVDEVDPTGADDCFCGTFIGLIDQGYSFEDAIAAANVAGAMHVSKRGPMEWNPSLSEIQNFST